MIPYPKISPEIISIGPLTLRWYGLMYVIGFVIGFHILKARIRGNFFKIRMDSADAFITWLVVGMLIGARLVYVFVYNWDQYALRPIEIFYVHQGGLSFHGAALGMITASLIFAWRKGVAGYSALDTLAIGACLGLFIGRIGNFINAELYGRVTDVPWAMIFPTDPKQLPRHPSQLYQGLTEGLLLFLSLSFIHRRMVKRALYRDGVIGATFLILYGVFRFLTEYTREPDAQLGLLSFGLSMGQILCALMIVAGIAMYVHVRRVSPLQKLKAATVATPEGLDRFDRLIWWPLERFLARFVA